MAEDQIAGLWDEEEEFDRWPLMTWTSTRRTWTTTTRSIRFDYPTMRNMPEDMRREAVYSPERQGGAVEAVLSLFDHNPARRPVLVSILGWCDGGC